MTFYPNRGHRTLRDSHRHTLEVGSAISREILEENGVYSIVHGSELPEGFSGRQRRRAPGMLFAATRPNGKTSYSFRPDGVDPQNPGHKYEQPCKALGGPGNVLAVPAGSQHLIEDTRVPVVFVEGIKKMLAVVSAARRDGAVVLVVAISGVWNWLSDGKPISDMLDIPMEGREVYIGFDSDVFRNPDVTDAARRLGAYLMERGAAVYLSYLRNQADGSKTGADDYLAAGHTYGEYMATFRPFDAAELQRERLARSAALRASLLDLEQRFWAFAWSGMGGHSDRDVFRVLLDAAWESGKAVADGVRVRMAWGPLEVGAKISRRTLSKALGRLEDAGLLYRVPDEEKPGRAGAFVLRGSVNPAAVVLSGLEAPTRARLRDSQGSEYPTAQAPPTRKAARQDTRGPRGRPGRRRRHPYLRGAGRRAPPQAPARHRAPQKPGDRQGARRPPHHARGGRDPHHRRQHGKPYR